jgi:hypothetical protein
MSRISVLNLIDFSLYKDVPLDEFLQSANEHRAAQNG